MLCVRTVLRRFLRHSRCWLMAAGSLRAEHEEEVCGNSSSACFKTLRVQHALLYHYLLDMHMWNRHCQRTPSGDLQPAEWPCTCVGHLQLLEALVGDSSLTNVCCL